MARKIQARRRFVLLVERLVTGRRLLEPLHIANASAKLIKRQSRLARFLRLTVYNYMIAKARRCKVGMGRILFELYMFMYISYIQRSIAIEINRSLNRMLRALIDGISAIISLPIYDIIYACSFYATRVHMRIYVRAGLDYFARRSTVYTTIDKYHRLYTTRARIYVYRVVSLTRIYIYARKTIS